MGGVVPCVLSSKKRVAWSTDAFRDAPNRKGTRAKRNAEPDITSASKHMLAEALDGIQARTWLDDLCASLWLLPELMGGFRPHAG